MTGTCFIYLRKMKGNVHNYYFGLKTQPQQKSAT